MIAELVVSSSSSVQLLGAAEDTFVALLRPQKCTARSRLLDPLQRHSCIVPPQPGHLLGPWKWRTFVSARRAQTNPRSKAACFSAKSEGQRRGW